MIELQRYKRLINEGFSLMTIGEGKKPNYKWKELQKNPLNEEEFERRFNNPTTKGVGILTGYGDLECIDVDLKVFSTAMEKKDFWETLISYLEDSILDFHDKFIITKTQNEGYHILYRSKRVQGNQDVAKLKGHQACVIETRGIGGYVFVYDRFINKKYYTDIQYISDEDREILFDICDSFDYKEELPKIEPDKKQTKEFESVGDDITPWDDFDSKNDVWDIVSSDFTIVRNLKDRIVIKRHGATSTHSGYIFKDNGCMYLHSSGTIYPQEKQLSPYAAYTFKNHHGDFSESAKELYADGYGSRRRIVIPEIKDSEIIEQKARIKKSIDFPIEVFPKPFQKYMLDCAETLNSSIDYMGCSLLWSLSVIVGNSAMIRIKNDWKERPVLWFALVGKAGVGKTHSIERIIRPLRKENGRMVRRYRKELDKFEYYQNLSKKEQSQVDEVKKPSKEQFIVGDATIEALAQLHQESANSVGIFRDELAGWILDMNKYREGSDQQTWLGTWSGEPIVSNRVKASSNVYVGQPFLPILGGIQPSILSTFYTDDNTASGFTDRILLSYPDYDVQPYNDKEMDLNTVEWYDNVMTNFYRNMKANVTKNEDGDVEYDEYTWTPEGKKEWKRVMEKIYDMETSDDTNEYIKSILAKIKPYIARFALLLHIFKIANGEEHQDSEISENTVIDAEKLGDYFIFMAEKIKVSAKEAYTMRGVVKNDKLNNVQKVEEILRHDKDFNRTELADMLGVSRTTIYNYIKQVENK